MHAIDKLGEIYYYPLKFHWWFFTKTAKDWELVKNISRFGTVADTHPLFWQNSDRSAIPDAIGLWLRDCNAKDEFSRI